MSYVQITSDTATQCDCCHEPFEVEVLPDGNDQDRDFVDVPVECEKGNFCSEDCRSRAMYEAQNDMDKEWMRRYYLGAQLMIDNRRRVHEIMEEWELDIDDDPEIVTCTLSPDGGTRGVPGPEDDCEAFLMPMAVRMVVWAALRDGINAARMHVYEQTQNAEKWPTEYWQGRVVEETRKLAAAEAALTAFEALGRVAA